jgi:hypothetical protein
MLRDRYRKWGINDKNARPLQVAVAKRRLTTQTALLHSPRIEELNDDGSHIAQEPVSTQDEHELLGLRMVLSGLRPGSPRAALSTLDSRIHEILNGLSYWDTEVVIQPHTYLDPDFDISRPRSSNKSALGRQCFGAAIALIQSSDLWGVLEIIQIFSEYHALDWVDWLQGRPFEQCRILWLCCEYAAQKLGPQHPVTLICNWAARGLLFEDLTSISKGIYRLFKSQWPIDYSLSQRDIWIKSRVNEFNHEYYEWSFNRFLRRALDAQELRLQAVAAKSVS